MKRLRIVCTVLALTLIAYIQTSAQSETIYDIEHECICLVDSIAADTIIQFWRFTQSNNPGSYTVDVTFDFSSAYTPSGTLLSCKDYYLGDNPGGSGTLNTLAMWTGVSSLGNSSVTQSGTILSSSFTGSFRVPTGTNAQEPVWAEGMMRYDTDDDAFEGYSNSSGSEFFFAEAAAASFTGNSVLYADANGRITEDNTNFYYSSDILKLGTATKLRIDPIAGFTTSLTVQIGTTATQASGSVAIGYGATTGNYDAVGIGKSATASGANSTSLGTTAQATAGYSTALGFDAQATTGAGNVAVGNSSRSTGTSSALAVGDQTQSTGDASTAIGSFAQATAGSSTALGNRAKAGANSAISIGYKAYSSGLNSIAIGDSTVATGNYQFVAGTITSVAGVFGRGYIENVYFGSGIQRNGKAGAGISYTLNGSGASGTDQAGGNITIGGGKGTGSGTPGYFSISTSTPLGSGTTLQSLSERARFHQDSVYFYKYGEGTITGTTAYTAAWNSAGKFIERQIAYAEMYIDDADPDTITFAGGGTTPAEGTDWTAGDLSNFTYSAGRLTYTGTETAKFLINTSISFSFSEGSVNVEGWVYKDGAEITGSEFHRKIGTGGDIGNAGSVCIVELATNAYIELFFAPEAHTGDDNIIISNANCSIIKL